jgi:hypothetical protein
MSLADEPQLAGVARRIADVFADEDDRRLELLDWLEDHGHGSTPFNRIPAEVLEQARRELGHPAPSAAAPPVTKTFTPDPAPPAPADAKPPATPAKETTMPCGNCGSKDHNRRTCSKPPAGATVKAAPKPPPPPKPARPARGARIEIRVETVDDLLGRRDELLAELDQVDGRIARALAAKEDELAKLRAAVKAASQRAAAAAEKAA